MKLLFILFTLLLVRIGFSQQLVTVHKVTKDTVALKWLPSTYEQLVKMSKGATISRTMSDKPIHFELVDFTNAKIWTIEPLSSRFALLGTSEEEQKFNALLEPIIKGSTDKEQANFVVMTNVIENMVNPRFQSVLGNVVYDTDFDPSKTYVYKIEIAGLAPVYSFVDPYQITLYSTIDISLLLDRKKSVSIEWDAKSVADQSLGFFVEHATDQPINGSYLDELPFIPFSSQFEKEDKKSTVIDEPLEGHFHYYRVLGLDPFGQASLHSSWEKIYVPLSIHAIPYIDTIRANQTERIIEVSASLLKVNPQIDSWALLRSEQKDSDFITIATKPYSDSTQTFVVNEKPSGDHFYYKIVLINKDDSVSSLPYYFFTLDQEPPNPPSNVEGTINEKGIVSINWTAPVDDDIEGYRVFRANHKREEFIEKTTKLNSVLSFSDTLALDNLTSEVYYFVQAVDQNFNNSAPSDTILLLKPDTIPPMAASLKSIKIIDTTIVILWENSMSSDLKRTLLIRNNMDTIPLKLDQRSYTDQLIEAGNQYSYQLICEDEQANQSQSEVFSQYYETGIRKPLKQFKVSVDRTQKHVVLTWEAPKEAVYSYKILRAKDDGTLTYLKSISDPSALSYIDNNISLGRKYTYSINYTTTEGIQSIPAQQEVIY